MLRAWHHSFPLQAVSIRASDSDRVYITGGISCRHTEGATLCMVNCAHQDCMTALLHHEMTPRKLAWPTRVSLMVHSMRRSRRAEPCGHLLRSWQDNNGPEQTDYVSVKNLIDACPKSLQRFVLNTSIGVERRRTFPFLILNLFGVAGSMSCMFLAARMWAREVSSAVSAIFVFRHHACPTSVTLVNGLC